MAGSFEAGAGAIVAGAEASARTREEVNKQISDVRAKVEAIGPGWQGAASMQMRQTVDQWIASATKVNDVLLEFEANLRSTDSDYTANEEEQSAQFQNYAARLG